MNRVALVLPCIATSALAAGEASVSATMRISSDWGVLEVQNVALLRPDWSAVSIAAPTTLGSTLKGDGWTLELKPNWSVVPAGRRGDFTLQGPAQ
jgi:hypothetical protein